MSSNFVSIALDGPSGAGKSTVAKGIARKLSFIYVDTGALYRTVGLYAIRHSVPTKDEKAVSAMLDDVSVSFGYINGEQRVYLNGEDVSSQIRTAEVAMAASDVSAHPSVRSFLLSLQRNIAENNNIIMDGRDIGTVILPNATYKFFITATPAERARRRQKDLIAAGKQAEYEDVLRQINERDYNDTHRATAPLRQADDAIYFDNTGIGLEENIERIIEIMKERGFSGDIK